jgi:hypothetical protein
MPERFAAIVPIGPTPAGLWQGVELIRNLLRWEPHLEWCVILDDAPRPRGLSELAIFPASCRTVTLARPLKASGGAWYGTLSAAMLSALDWIHRNSNADFVLRIDTDALVIAPFARSIQSFLARTPDAGVVGSIGKSSNPRVRATQNMSFEPRLLRALRLWPAAPANDETSGDTIELGRFGRVSIGQRRRFDGIRPHIQAAIRQGYSTYEYCQGGVCVVSRLMVDRMAERGYLAQADLWSGLPFPDDYVFAMYAKAVGLRVYDYSGPGEPFAVQARGLPFPPDELVTRRHALIHSIKNDEIYDEATIREFFEARV